MDKTVQPTRILLVEDESVIALDLKAQLESLGYAVPGIAATGAAAIAQAGTLNPDVVLMDIHLKGGMDGTEAARRIQETRVVPIIFLTAYSDESTMALARNSQPYGFLVKPIDPNELHATIQMALVRHASERALRRSEQRLRLALDAAALSVWEWDPGSGHLTTTGGEFQHRFEHLSGTFRTPMDAFRAVVHTDDQPLLEAALKQAFSDGALIKLDVRYVDPGGSIGWIQMHLQAHGDNGVAHLLGVVRDVTEQHRRDEQLAHDAHHDPLTGLPNRALFEDRLQQVIEIAQRNQQRCALLFIDLDRFKFINDTLGHAAGDRLLRELADRIRHSLRRSDTAARLGGDEFVVIMNTIAQAEDSVVLASKLLTALAAPVELAGHLHTISVSIGISMYPQDGTDSEQLLKAADTAMYEAKSQGRNRYCLHSTAGA